MSELTKKLVTLNLILEQDFWMFSVTSQFAQTCQHSDAKINSYRISSTELLTAIHWQFSREQSRKHSSDDQVGRKATSWYRRFQKGLSSPFRCDEVEKLCSVDSRALLVPIREGFNNKIWKRKQIEQISGWMLQETKFENNLKIETGSESSLENSYLIMSQPFCALLFFSRNSTIQK